MKKCLLILLTVTVLISPFTYDLSYNMAGDKEPADWIENGVRFMDKKK